MLHNANFKGLEIKLRYQVHTKFQTTFLVVIDLGECGRQWSKTEVAPRRGFNSNILETHTKYKQFEE